MSADTLREAAKLMRERAEAATPGPWWSDDSDECWRLHGTHAVVPTNIGGQTFNQVMNRQILKAPKSGTPYAEYWPSSADAAQITSWHPLVALAVADWLEACARDLADVEEAYVGFSRCDEPASVQSALKVARAYLGGAA